MKSKNPLFNIFTYVALALCLRFIVVDRILESTQSRLLQAAIIVVVFGVGIGYVFRGTATVIEEIPTTCEPLI